MVDPFGVVIANTGEASGVIFTELSAERTGVVRARVPSLLNRRFTVAPLEHQPSRVKPEKA
jgi:hypothetical protein